MVRNTSKDVDEWTKPISVHLKIKNIKYLDSLVSTGSSRGKILDEWLDEHRRRQELKRDIVMRGDEVEGLFKAATFTDFEKIFDAYTDIFLEPLKYESRNGRDIERLIPTFEGLVEKILGKHTDHVKIRSFLRDKMEELSVTDF